MEKLHLSTDGVSILFPGVKALSDVDFHADSATIHAVVGANGAGKSTLMKVLTGVYGHYTGRVLLNGGEVPIRVPHDAQKLGIQIVHQEVDAALVPSLSVAENIMLNDMVNGMGRRQVIKWNNLYRRAEETLSRLHVRLDVKKQVREISLAEKQMVLIARALVRESRFLILDEPTAPLSNTETEELFRVVRDLAATHGVGVIFVSHRLPEIFAICEDITIMRDGQIIVQEKVANLSINDVVEHMLGRTFGDAYPKYEAQIGGPLLEVNGLSTREREIEDISFHVRRGEIVGIAGLVGAGKSELCKALFADLRISAGEIRLDGRTLKNRTPHQAVRSGLALVPEERRKEGVLLEEPVYSNLSLAKLSKYCTRAGFIRRTQERAMAVELIQKLGVKTPDETCRVELLSGGNQQKVGVGKWLNADAEVYLFDEPTKGVDVGAKQDIFHLIGQMAAQGKGVVYATCEINEILGITDRVYVMYDHRIVKELVTAQTSEKEILFLSTGGRSGDADVE